MIEQTNVSLKLSCGFSSRFLIKSVVEGDIKRGKYSLLLASDLNKSGQMDKVKLRDQYFISSMVQRFTYRV